MKKFTKLITLLLAIAMLASATVACNSDPQPPAPEVTTNSAEADTTLPTDTTTPADTTTPGPVTPPEPVFDTPATITIKKDGAALNYVITRPNIDTAANEIKAAQRLSAFLVEKTGVTPTIDTDWAKKEDSEKLEIIIGATDHPETATLFDEASYGGYVIRAVGNKLIILAFSDAGFTKALKTLEKALGRGYNRETKEITVDTANLSCTEEVASQLAALPMYEGGAYLATYYAGRVSTTTSCDEIIIKDTTASEFDEYLSKLEASGYTQYTTNNVSDNKFAIYTSDEYMLNVGYYDYEKSARLLVEPLGALPPREEDNNYDPKNDKVTTAQLTMIAVSEGNKSNGLSTLIRLEDGRFIMVDGAWGECYPHLAKTIKEQAKEYTDKPVIAAWIGTHGHGDHCSLLAGQAYNLKSDGITVERIIVNSFTPDDDNPGNPIAKIIDISAPVLGAELFKGHVGQAFYLGNCKLEIVFTMEAYAPKGINAYNGLSVVAKMTFTDSETGEVTTFLSTGDSTGVSMQCAKNIFKDYIKCDIICLPHHGGTTYGTENEMAEAFRAMAPSLVLFPCGNNTASRETARWFNQVLFESDYYRETYYAGDRGVGGSDVLVPFPYVPGNVQRIPH